MKDLGPGFIAETSVELIDKLLAQKQVLISGYQELLEMLDRPGNISKQELSASIIATLQKHNEK